MIETREAAQQKIQELCDGAWAVSALAIVLERGVDADEPVVRAALGVLTAHGLCDAAGAPGPGFAALIAGNGAAVARSDLRSALGTVNHAVDAASTPGAAIAGWRADDERLVEAQGLVSQAATAQLARAFAAMPGVDERLRAGGAVLDVGAGAAGLGIALAATYPSVRVVGIEPSQVAVAVGRRRIAEAGVADRVELRAHGGEALIDVDA